MSNEFKISESLKSKGVSKIAKDGNTISVDYNNIPIRCTIYSNDITKTTRILEKSCTKFVDNNIIIQEIILTVSKYWNEIIDNNDNNNSRQKNITVKLEQERPISYLEWKTNLLEKYDNLLVLVKEKYPELMKPLAFALSVRSILNIKDCTLPFIGIILGPPSSVKTLTIGVFRGSDDTYYTDNFSAKAFVSHNTSVKREQLEDIDMLPRIKNKLFLTPELSPTFSKKEDELNEILGIITRIADGNGYESDSGAQGHRGYTGEYTFTWLGAAVDIPRKVHKLLGTLGPKLYFYRLSNRKNKKEEDDLEKLQDSDNFNNNLAEIKKLLIDYIEWYENCPIAEELKDSNHFLKINWDSEKDDKQILRYIIRLAKLLAHLRGVVPTWETRDTQGSEYAYTFSTKEEPDRAMIQLRNLARGHALSQGRNYVTVDDIEVVIETVLSTASRERVIIFDCLLKHNGQLTAREIQDSLHITAPTALRTMTEFAALDLVDEISLGSADNPPKQIQLKQEFSWFLTEDFKRLRSGFGKQYLNEYLQEKESHRLKVEVQDLDFYPKYKEKIPLSNANFYDTEQECYKEHYPIMIYDRDQSAIQPNKKYFQSNLNNKVN